MRKKIIPVHTSSYGSTVFPVTQIHTAPLSFTAYNLLSFEKKITFFNPKTSELCVRERERGGERCFTRSCCCRRRGRWASFGWPLIATIALKNIKSSKPTFLRLWVCFSLSPSLSSYFGMLVRNRFFIFLYFFVSHVVIMQSSSSPFCFSLFSMSFCHANLESGFKM